MTEIDVPDWVVEAAMRAEDKFYAEKNYGSFSDIQGDDAAEAMRAAIAAALGAWVVPEQFQSRARFMEYEWCPWQTFNDEHGREAWFEVMSRAEAWQAEKRDLYTLRQEEPE